jgi:hypothetical protein
MTSTREFLKAQKAALDAEIKPLEQKLADLRSEMGDVEKALKALGPTEYEKSFRNAFFSFAYDDIGQTAKGMLREGTIKDFVVRVLSDRPEGMVAIDILAAINRRFGTEYPRTSLSPQLSRLKNEGILELDGLVWRLVKEKGPAVGPAEPVSNTGGG